MKRILRSCLLPVLFCLFCCGTVEGQIITTIAGSGIAGFNGDGMSALITKLNKPNTLAFDKDGNLYITDCSNYRIRKINKYGIMTTVAGNGISGFSGDGGPATAAELSNPVGITVDNMGNLYISTAGDDRIRKVSVSGIISTVAGTGIGGYNGDGISSTSAQLRYPYVGMTDYEGNLYFSDYGNHRVRKISTTGIISTIAGNGINGTSGDGSSALTAELGGPCWLFINTSGDVYIPDNVFNCVRKVDALGIITTFAGTGVIGNTGDGGPATAATFTQLNSITFDNVGNAYIADYGANVIRKVNTKGIISTIAGTGISGYNGDEIPASSAEINPNAVACDPSGNVYIADLNDYRIRRINYNNVGVNGINKPLQNVTIHPNPAHEIISITAGEEIESVEVVNVVGQIKASPRPSPGGMELTFNIADLPNGIYFAKVNGLYAGRFVKE